MQQDLFVNPNISEVTLSYSHSVPATQRETIRGSAQSADILRPYFKDIELRESVYILLLNQGQQVLGVWWASVGGITGTIADIRMIIVAALKAHATRIIMAHNHPSGTLAASDADMRITQQLKTACIYMDITLMDHVILTKESFYSFADSGIL